MTFKNINPLTFIMPNSNDNDGGLTTHSDATSGTSDEMPDATVVLSIQNS